MGKVEKKVSKVKCGSIAKGKDKKSKEDKKKKHLALVPRLRLEPRLTPGPSKKNEDYSITIEKDKKLIVLLNKNEVNEQLRNCNLHKTLSYVNSHSEKNVKERNEVSDALNMSSTENNNNRGSTLDCSQSSVSINNAEDSDYENFIFKKPRKRLVRKSVGWSDRELKDLAYGLQSQGFSDLKKVSEFVKTKNDNDICEYMRLRRLDARNNETRYDSDKRPGRPVNRWTTVYHEALETWPNVRKWRRLAYEQMMIYTRAKDYSKPVLASLCKRFYEEEEEPDDPQVINVKLIYKYMMDCMDGHLPPLLPPKESALVLDLLRELQSLVVTHDFEEEIKFLQEFRGATKFRPFQVKDEFKKKLKNALDSEECASNTVSVPEEVFNDLSRHKRLVQSFNPLMTPVWMLQKEQENLQNYAEELNVYVD